jgi:hypothetical protein
MQFDGRINPIVNNDRILKTARLPVKRCFRGVFVRLDQFASASRELLILHPRCQSSIFNLNLDFFSDEEMMPVNVQDMVESE